MGECLKKFEDSYDDITSGNQAFLADIAASYVGFSYGLKFAEFCELECKHEIDLNEVLNNFTEKLGKHLTAEFKVNPKAAVPAAHGLLDMVQKIELSEKQSKNILGFLECCPSEAVAAFLKGWQKECKDQFMEWRSTPRRHKVFNGCMMNKERKGGKPSAYENWVAAFTKQHNLTEADMDRDDIRIAA